MFGNMIRDIWTSTPGLENLLLSGIDGIVIEKKNDTEDDDLIAAEAGNLIKECQRFGQELNSGPLQFFTTRYEHCTVAIQMVTEDYFLLGIVKDPKYMGVVRYQFNLKSYEWYSAIA